MAKKSKAKEVIRKVAWLRIWRRELLMVRNHGSVDLIHPGGKVKPSESKIKALTREIKEELGVRLRRSTIEYVFTLEVELTAGKHKGKLLRSDFYFADYRGRMRAQREVAERAWVRSNTRRRLTAMSKLCFKQLKMAELVA